MNHRKTCCGRDFTQVVAGQIISLFGNAILRFALSLYLVKETGSSALFGTVTACALLTMILLSLLGGVLADRMNKRNIMAGLDFLTAFVITVFYILVGMVPVVPLFIVTLMLLYGISGTVMGAGMLLVEQLRFLKYLILSGTGLLVMVFSTMFGIQMLAVVQTQTPAELTGKVVACIMAFIMCARAAGQLLYGLLFEKISVKTPFIMVGTGAVSFFIELYAKKILKELGGEEDNA